MNGRVSSDAVLSIRNSTAHSFTQCCVTSLHVLFLLLHAMEGAVEVFSNIEIGKTSNPGQHPPSHTQEDKQTHRHTSQLPPLQRLSMAGTLLISLRLHRSSPPSTWPTTLFHSSSCTVAFNNFDMHLGTEMIHFVLEYFIPNFNCWRSCL